MKKGKISKAVGILTILSAIITLISGVYNFLLPIFLLHKFQVQIKEVGIDIKEAGSIGIIGGADGPTAIYVSGHLPNYSGTIVFGLIAIIGFSYLMLLKNRKI